MKRKRLYNKCIAFLLLLVFSQKAGAGLFIHNFLHTSKVSEQSAEEHNTSKGYSYNCTCADDFLMPFLHSDEVVFITPALVHATLPVFFSENIPFHFPVLSLLRGPPAAVIA